MPYIDPTTRDSLKPTAEWNADHPGELAFQFYSLALDYVRCNGRTYQVLNDVMGAFEATKLEFKRRQIDPYEDGKILENGDVK